MAVAAVAVAALTAACGSSSAAPAPPAGDVNGIVDRAAVRVCSTGDYRPFTFRDGSGKWSGMDIDMAGDLAKRLGVQLQLVQTTWGNMMNDLGTRCDMAMGGISVTLDRAKQALYSSPYLRDGKAAIVRCSDQGKSTNLAQIDRPGVRVVVNPDGTNAQFVNGNVHKAAIVPYPDNNTISGELTNGHADVMITDTREIRRRPT
jgi:cyclohexadienyl dehydratase